MVMKKLFVYMLVGACCFFACSEDEDTTPSLKDTDRLEELIDKSNKTIMDFKEKYGTYILYQFDQLLDFAYQFDQAASWRAAELTYLEKEEVEGAVDFLMNRFMACYGDSVKVNYLPRKVLMCCKIKARQLGISIPRGGDLGDHDAAANMNSFTVAGLDNANLTAMSEERLEEYVRQLHYIFLAGYVVNVRRLMFVEDTFFDPCKTLYGTEVERDKNVQLPAEDYLKLGFFPITDIEEYSYPLELDDLIDFVENLVKMDQEMHDTIMEYELMKAKMQNVAGSLKAMGVAVEKINPLAVDFL